MSVSADRPARDPLPTLPIEVKGIRLVTYPLTTVRIDPRRALAGDCVKTPFGSTPVPGHLI